jgi:hypothetical protein
VTDRAEDRLSQTLLPVREALHLLEPSAALDARIDLAVSAWSARRSARARWRSPAWPVAWATAASALFVALGLRYAAHQGAEPETAAVKGNRTESTTWPTGPEAAGTSESRGAPAPKKSPQSEGGAAVFRVRATLGTYGAGRAEHSGLAGQHFWVEVGVASDGSLHIVRVAPTGTGETFVP